jgi:hypothetical protein
VATGDDRRALAAESRGRVCCSRASRRRAGSARRGIRLCGAPLSTQRHVRQLRHGVDGAVAERSSHYVRLTAAGMVFQVEARQILAHVDRAAAIARRPPVRRTACGSAWSTSAGPADGGLLTGPAGPAGRAGFRQPSPRRVAGGAGRGSRGGAAAAGRGERAPEFNQFVIELCRSVESSRRGGPGAVISRADEPICSWSFPAVHPVDTMASVIRRGCPCDHFVSIPKGYPYDFPESLS